MGMIPQFKSAVMNMFNTHLDRIKDSQQLDLNVLSNDTLVERTGGIELDAPIQEEDINQA